MALSPSNRRKALRRAASNTMRDTPGDAVEEVGLDHGHLAMGPEVGPKCGDGIGRPWGGGGHANGKTNDVDERKSFILP